MKFLFPFSFVAAVSIIAACDAFVGPATQTGWDGCRPNEILCPTLRDGGGGGCCLYGEECTHDGYCRWLGVGFGRGLDGGVD